MTARIHDNLRIDYFDIFGEEPRELEHYLTGINRGSLMLVGVHFIASHNPHEPTRDFRTDVDPILAGTNGEFRHDLFQRISRFLASKKITISPKIINPPASLIFFEYVFNRSDEPNVKTDEELRKSILLAYLVINRQLRQGEHKSIASTENFTGEAQFTRMHFAQAFPYASLFNYNDDQLVYCQYLRATLFFKFLESKDSAKPLLTAFLNDVQQDSWEKYLKRFVSIVAGIKRKQAQPGHRTFTVRKGENYENDCKFLDQLITADSQYDVEVDFKALRDKPLYKVSEGVYRVVFGVFVYEKVYRSLYFRLARVNRNLTPKLQINNLQSFIGEEFSERVIGYSVLDRMFKRKHNVALSGHELKMLGVKAEPDYYARDGKRIFIFESKDFLIDADDKASFDYDRMEKAFKKRLYLEGDKRKAVLQLCHTISSLLDRTFKGDTVPTKAIEIYPVIIVHDYQYNIVGLNKIVNTWFLEELKKLGYRGESRDRVWPVSIIDIDTLIYNECVFRKNKLKFHSIVEDYHRFVKIDQRKKYPNWEAKRNSWSSKLASFPTYLSGLMRKRRIIPDLDWYHEIKGYLYNGEAKDEDASANG